jgi:WD40 repeat protein
MLVLQRRPANACTINSAVFSGDGRWLLSGSEGYWPTYSELKLWNVAERLEQGLVLRRAAGFYAAAVSPDGQTIAAALGDKTVRLWDMPVVLAQLQNPPQRKPDPKGIKERRRYETARASWSILFTADGRHLAVGVGNRGDKTGSGALDLLDLTAGVMMRVAGGRAVWSLACNATGTVIAVGLGKDSIVLYDRSLQEPTATLEQEHAVRAVAVSPDGRMVASAAGWDVKLWDLATRAEIATLEGHKQLVWSLAFSPDGRLLASGAGDGVVRFWEVPGGRLLTAFDWKVGRVSTLAFAPDGMTAVAGGDGENNLVLWDVDV